MCIWRVLDVQSVSVATQYIFFFSLSFRIFHAERLKQLIESSLWQKGVLKGHTYTHTHTHRPSVGNVLELSFVRTCFSLCVCRFLYSKMDTSNAVARVVLFFFMAF